MAKVQFTIDINAPKQKVWEVMLSPETYPKWTEAFQPGSNFKGSWDKGSTIRFVDGNSNSVNGMVAKVVENTPGEVVSLEILGEVVDGKDDVTSESAKQWAGATESYYFSETNGVTTLRVELESANAPQEMTAQLEAMWPKALDTLKALVEQA